MQDEHAKLRAHLLRTRCDNTFWRFYKSNYGAATNTPHWRTRVTLTWCFHRGGNYVLLASENLVRRRNPWNYMPRNGSDVVFVRNNPSCCTWKTGTIYRTRIVNSSHTRCLYIRHYTQLLHTLKLCLSNVIATELLEQSAYILYTLGYHLFIYLEMEKIAIYLRTGARRKRI